MWAYNIYLVHLIQNWSYPLTFSQKTNEKKRNIYRINACVRWLLSVFSVVRDLTELMRKSPKNIFTFIFLFRFTGPAHQKPSWIFWLILIQNLCVCWGEGIERTANFYGRLYNYTLVHVCKLHQNFTSFNYRGKVRFDVSKIIHYIPAADSTPRFLINVENAFFCFK